MDNERKTLLEEQLAISKRLLTLLGRDIRTQLYSLLGLSDRYLNVKDLDSRTGTDLVGMIYASQDSMMDVLDDILEISNFAEEDLPVQKEPVSLPEMFSGIEKGLSARLGIRSQSLVCSVEEGVCPDVITDEHILYQILTKLLKFVMQHTGKNQWINCSVSMQQQVEDRAEYLFRVRSEGCLISQDETARAMQPYSSLAVEIARNADDIDTSLIVLKKYVDLLQGKLHLIPSEEGVIDLMVELPLELTDHVGEEEQAEEVHPDYSGKTALIIDDDIINLEVSIRLLQNVGMFVVEATNGQEGLKAYEASQGRFDLVLLDIRMPGISGLDVARKIRSFSTGSEEVPIIALSSNATPEDEKKSAEAGINKHLAKPVEPHRLYEILREYLG